MNPNSFSQQGGSSGGAINPAMLSAFQNSQKATGFPGAVTNLNPAQILNNAAGGIVPIYPNNISMGMGMGMNGSGNTISPSQLMHQQQQQSSIMLSGGGGGGSINPAVLTAPSSSSSQHQPQHQQQQHHPQHSSSSGPQINIYAMLNALGISREQFAALSPQDRNLAAQKYMSAAHMQNTQFERMQQQQLQIERERQSMAMGMPNGMGGMGSMGGAGMSSMGNMNMSNMNMGMGSMSHMSNASMGGMSHMSNQGQGQQQHSQQQAFDRPSSSASSHSTSHAHPQSQQQNQMMPPPPPRPPTAQGHGGQQQQQLSQQQLAQAQAHQQQQQQGQHLSRPGTALSHRSPTIPGPGSGSMHDMMQQQQQQQGQGQQRPQSRMAQRGDGMMNGFKPSQPQQGQPQQQQQQQQGPSHHHHHQQPNQQSMFNASQGQAQRPPSSQGHHPQSSSAQAPNNPAAAANASNAPHPHTTSASPPASMGSPYRGAKRKLAGEMVSSAGGGGMGSQMGGGGAGGMSSMNPMGGMPGMGPSSMGGGMNPMNPMNPMSGMPGSMGSSMAGMPNMSGMQGMANMPGGMGGNMAALAQMGGMGGGGGGGGGGIPGSPRIGGGGLGLGGMGAGPGGMTGPGGMGGAGGGVMGPPGLPRSVSGDGMGMNAMNNMGGMGNLGGGGGGGMSNLPNMGGINNMSNMSNMPNMGGMGGGSMPGNMPGNINMGNMGMSNMMNGAPRGSPRPQSSMGMAGMQGGMGGMGGMGMGGGGGGMGGMSISGGAGGVGGMNMGGGSGAGGMGMNVDMPSRVHMPQGGMGGISAPQTPMRQGSLPPQSTPTPSQMPPQLQNQGPGTPMRQGSLPPSSSGPMGPQPGMGMGGGGVGGGMPMNMGQRASLPNTGGMNIGMGMNMGMGGSSGPHPPSSPRPGGGIGGPQAMTMTPSISSSSIGSMSGGGMPNVGGPQMTASAAAGAQVNSLGGVPGGVQAASGGLGPNVGAPGAMPASSSSTGGAEGLSTGAASPAGPIGGASGSSLMAPPPPLPSHVNYNPKTTEITIVPLLTSLTTIPPLSSEEISQVKEWMATDRAYEGLLRQMQGRMLDEAREVFSVGGAAGPMWWDRGAPGNGTGNWNRWRRGRESFDVRYPRTRREGVSRSGRKGARREGLKLPRKIDPEDANRPETLVPIRIEFDVEHHKMRDTFVWNLNDAVVTPEAFAQSIVEDYNLAPSYHSVIVKSIQDQLSDFRAHSTNYDGDGAELFDNDAANDGAVIKGTLDEENAKWWDVWRRRVKLQSARAIADANALAGDGESGKTAKRNGSRQRSSSRKRRKMVKNEDDPDADVSMLADNEDEQDDEKDESERKNKAVSFDLDDEAYKPLSVEEIMLNEKAMHEDMRILIKLDIIVGSIKLDDQFEWDLDNPMASPEEFAEVYAQELGLGGEFKTAISHSIREQVQTYNKSLFLVGHPSDGTAVQDDDLKQSFLPSLTSGARPVGDVLMFTPLLNYLSDGELERTEKERDKDLNKRRKRNTRGRRGIALPDREPIRTYRTPAIGFPELDAATLALAAAANAPMSRRAAAAAASLTIANMVASENGTAFMPQTMPSAPQPTPAATTPKDKKPKGLFKAPTYPSSVLRPRALVVAPTPSTAADVSSMPPVPADNEAPRSSSSAAPPPPDNRTNKVLTAKKQKELEREAKEKEFVDGQHPNYIDGVWHCSNCGCPESIAVGRRKGPLGDKSQCGTCGKFWHRHRRPRPVEYNSDPDFHSGVKQKEADATKTPASKKKGAAAALRAQSAAHSATPAADASEPQTPTRSNGDVEGSSRKSPTPAAPANDDDRAMSPVSTASSASEPPLAQRVKMNGHHSKPTPTPAPAPATPVKPQPADPTSTPAPPAAAPVSPSKTWPPPWLSSAMQAMQARYPNDRFEVILRKVNASSTPEWRIKCLDCPGKLYTPGPGETLSNYDVHLKNRQHRQRVNDRLDRLAAAATEGGADTTKP